MTSSIKAKAKNLGPKAKDSICHGQWQKIPKLTTIIKFICISLGTVNTWLGKHQWQKVCPT